MRVVIDALVSSRMECPHVSSSHIPKYPQNAIFYDLFWNTQKLVTNK